MPTHKKVPTPYNFLYTVEVYLNERPPATVPLFVQLFALRVLSCYKHDMGALSWLSDHSPFWHTCKVLRPWALIRETRVMVSINLFTNLMTWISFVLA